MISRYFATDRVNYVRYVPCYWLETSCLEKIHPYVAAHSSSVACCQAIEQALNRDSNMKERLVGMTLNRGAVHRWVTGEVGRSGITRQFETMANETRTKRYFKVISK